jgi:hypothetical protein
MNAGQKNKKKMKNSVWIVLAVLLAFSVYSLICLYPYTNSLTENSHGIDDWNRYTRYALDIKNNGLSLPSVNETYFAPAGFLYNYFLAFCFVLFGENDVPVYIVQNIMLGTSVLLIFFSFKEKLGQRISHLLLICLILFAFFDVAKYYTFRFLSENLALFLISLFIYCISKKGRSVYFYFGSAILGLLVLTRPNVIVFVFVFFMTMIYFRIKGKLRNNIGIMILLFTLTASLLFIRNLYVCGRLNVLPEEGLGFAEESLTNFSFSLFFKKILFCLGIFSPLDPSLMVRPHWVAFWIIYLYYLLSKWRTQENFDIAETMVHLFVFSYFITLSVVAPVINSYGYRLLIPGIFFLIPFVFLSIGKFGHKKKSSFLH